ncbi:intracellular exo-alpha-(1-_5)-L-arabinofuranosidase [Abditibacteriota bacterium]|nr:intracellular exo-alpha-(1->5)-L-arabinofuranosidase [Abditibacteriota bacterium]
MPCSNSIVVSPAPRHELSPHLYMQFMEPLGTTDGSVEAAWDHQNEAWRPDLVEVTRDLAPGMLRWGGCLSSYYRWEEAVGPRSERRPMLNLLWGGVESNQIGTVEFVDFCRQVEADALFCVNFESDGRLGWANPRVGGNRCGNAEEAARWVSYCNREDDILRRSHEHNEELRVPFWQIGNETSYDPNGFDVETAAQKTVEFAQAIRAVDPSVRLIGWGDDGWAPRMIEVAGEYLDYVAFHHMFHPSPDDPILDGTNYRRDPQKTWEVLMNAVSIHERKLLKVRSEVEGTGKKLALTECHFAINGRDRGDVMASWAVGVSYARMMLLHQRHGDLLEIATLSDFCGTRWQVNSVIMPTPGGRSYLLPVAHVMRLFRRYSGTHAVEARGFPATLDVTASRTENRVFLHVVNISRDQAVTATLQIEGHTVRAGRVWELAADPETEILQSCPDVIQVVEKPLENTNQWTFPAASVSVVELEI